MNGAGGFNSGDLKEGGGRGGTTTGEAIDDKSAGSGGNALFTISRANEPNGSATGGDGGEATGEAIDDKSAGRGFAMSIAPGDIAEFGSDFLD